MAIRALSVDFDGCLSNVNFIALAVTWEKYKGKKPLDKEQFNASLIEILNKMGQAHRPVQELQDLFTQYYNPKKHDLNLKEIMYVLNKPLFDALPEADVLLVGSNRQSYFMDSMNGKNLVPTKEDNPKPGSCYPYYQFLAGKLKATLNTFLMADLYQGKKDGQTMREALRSDYDPNNEKNKQLDKEGWLNDEHKLSLLCTQVQKLLEKHPKEPIIFDFVDDRDDILKALTSALKAKPDLIHQNVQVNLWKYDGQGKPQQVFSMQGQAKEQDPNYTGTLNQWVQQLKKNDKDGTMWGMNRENLDRCGAKFETLFVSPQVELAQRPPSPKASPPIPERKDPWEPSTQQHLKARLHEILGEHRKDPNALPSNEAGSKKM